MGKIQAVLFDKDDTLIELDSFWVDVTRDVVENMLCRLGCRQDETLRRDMLYCVGIRNEREVIPESVMVSGTNRDMGKCWEQCLSAHGVPCDGDVPALAEEIFEASYVKVRPTPTTPALKSILALLKEMGLKLGVVTSDSYHSTQYCLRELDVLNLMDALITADRVARPKPAPDSMLHARACFDLPADSFIMVGDSQVDMLFAKNACCQGIYVGKADTLPEGAVAKLKSLDELPAWIKAYNQAQAE